MKVQSPQIPVGIANVGNTCFAASVLQCLSTASIPDNIGFESPDALDRLVYSVQTQHSKQVMHLRTPLIREIFNTDLGLQGQQCPMQFFTASCRKGGAVAASFDATIGEILKCSDCGIALNTPQISSENYVQILTFNIDTKARTLTDLILENIVSPPIEGYCPAPHPRNNATLVDREHTNVSCENRSGAFHVRYFSTTLPPNLCFAFTSRTELSGSKNARYFAPEHTMFLPEINMASPPNSRDTRAAQYSLFATLVHTGQGSQNGHFAAYVLRAGSWFFMDDEYGRPVDASTATQPPPYQTIYMVFYRRVP